MEIKVIDRILCKECKWEGSPTQCKLESSEFIDDARSYLCPKCGTPLATERGEGPTQLCEENAAIMSQY